MENNEKKYEVVFGKTFELYTKKEINEFIEPFKIRFERNQIDPLKVFKDKNCFDAGCGGGRGSIFMLQNQASSVTCFDYSEININTTEKNLKDFGFSNYKVQQGSLENIPYEDESFDVVWCNGVIMHTKNPDKCLSEISRILKKGGYAWIYIYGSGGVYWYTIQKIRNWMKDIDTELCISVLQALRYETRYVAEFIDDWFASFLRTYTIEDMNRRLRELGFENADVLKYGVDYDTSQRVTLFGTNEKVWMGDGDLRYLIKKNSNPINQIFPIKDGEYGSIYTFPDEIKKNLDSLFIEMDELFTNNLQKIIISSYIQRELRIYMDKYEKFDILIYKEILKKAIRFLENLNKI